MAVAIDSSAQEGTDVVVALARASAKHGAEIGRAARSALASRTSRAARLDAVCGALTAYGYEPRLDTSHVLLVNCPFHALAQEHTELVCRMNLSLLEALVREVDDDTLTAELDPAPGRCCVTISTVRS